MILVKGLITKKTFIKDFYKTRVSKILMKKEEKGCVEAIPREKSGRVAAAVVAAHCGGAWERTGGCMGV